MPDDPGHNALDAGEPQRSCAGMGDGRSGLLPRPIVTIFKHFAQRGFEFFLLPSRVHARPSAMLPPSGTMRERKPLGRY